MCNFENNEKCAIIYINKNNYIIFQCTICKYVIHSFEKLAAHLTEHYKEIQIGKDSNMEEPDMEIQNHKLDGIEMAFDFVESLENKEEFNEIDEAVTVDLEGVITQSEYTIDHMKNSPEAIEQALITKDVKASVKCKESSLNIGHEEESNFNPFQCKICGSTFKDKYILGNHVLRHSGKKNFSCSQCSKKFYTRTEVKLHERCHNNERPCLCTICGKTFVTTSNMFKHMKRHNAIRPHKCEICGKGFHDKPDLWHHLPIHSDVRAFCCNKCSATFKQQKSLQAHMKIHFNKREYRCELCGASFNQGPGLRSHLKSKHRLEENISSE